MSLHHTDIKLLILWSFSTQKPQMWKFSDNCGFRYTFHKILSEYSQSFESTLIDLSLYSQPFESTMFLLAWGRYLWFHSSDLYLDWTLPKQPGYENCQATNSGSIWYHIHLIRSMLSLGTLKFPIPLPLSIRTGVGFPDMHALETSSQHVHAIFLIPLFFFSQ